jgi:hypothetical protein
MMQVICGLVRDVATSGYTTTNALINNGVDHPMTTVSRTISLNANTFYPIRIQYGQGGACYGLIIKITRPDSVSFTNGNSYFYRSTLTARYVRLEGGTEYINLSQLVARDSSNNNVAKLKTVRFSGYEANYPSVAVDGVEAARNYPAIYYSNTTTNAWFEVDLGSTSVTVF